MEKELYIECKGRTMAKVLQEKVRCHIMAIRFKEIRKYLARNARLSICFEDGHYHNYLMISEIPAEKYNDLYVYGVGMVDVEFSMDIYTPPKELDGVIFSTKDDTIEPALEIVLHETPRGIERKEEGILLFKDVKSYLQIGRNFAVVDREEVAVAEETLAAVSLLDQD